MSSDSVSEASCPGGVPAEESWTVEEGAIPSLRFPQKLWRIVNECRSGAIGWGSDGQTVRLNYKSFQEEYLSKPGSSFKTSNIASFIRQLNLYGFRKLATHAREQRPKTELPDVHEFLHEHFRAGRLDLLSRVCRKTGAKRLAAAANAKKPLALPTDNNCGLSRLQMCQLALTKALEQATRQYKKEKFWLQLSDECVSKDALKPKYETPMDSNIQIVFQDLSELQDNLQIIDMTAAGNTASYQDKSQWQEVFTLPKDTSISISVPYC